MGCVCSRKSDCSLSVIEPGGQAVCGGRILSQSGHRSVRVEMRAANKIVRSMSVGRRPQHQAEEYIDCTTVISNRSLHSKQSCRSSVDQIVPIVRAGRQGFVSTGVSRSAVGPWTPGETCHWAQASGSIPLGPWHPVQPAPRHMQSTRPQQFNLKPEAGSEPCICKVGVASSRTGGSGRQGTGEEKEDVSDL